MAPIGDSPAATRARDAALPALNGARLALFVVTGGSKADAVRRAFAPEPGVPALYSPPPRPSVLDAPQSSYSPSAPSISTLL